MTPADIPLSIYVHIPWCVKKCPYCDFNSHAKTGDLPEAKYVEALLRDLESEWAQVDGREVQSVFFGGGTPSLFSPEAIRQVLNGIRVRFNFARDWEVTLEANPGTVEQARFAGYREAGVNRLSIGIQSLSHGQLQKLGRIHGVEEARNAATAAHAAGFDNFNLDLMYALPAQTLDDARRDLEQLIELAPTHISYYQLTLEPGTPFFHRPPPLPEEDLAWDMQEQGEALLAAHGFGQYEVSAYAKRGRRCRHNLNYWEFGDYLGIGAGAHGKITQPLGTVLRTAKHKFPQAYMQFAGSAQQYESRRGIPNAELPFEYMLNALRLNDGVALADFKRRTGLALADVQPRLEKLAARGLLETTPDRVSTTPNGRRLLNQALQAFLPETQKLAPRKALV